MRLVIVTGLSGAGKTQMLKFLEDLGYYCVDNLPSMLIKPFMELGQQASPHIPRAAMGVDIRGGEFFDAGQVLSAMDTAQSSGATLELVYMDCAMDTLIARYKETRRDHPLARNCSLEEGIQREIELLQPLKEAANHVLDTTGLTIRELRRQATELFEERDASNAFRVELASFGFKRGLPRDADMVFDVRFLPNPYYVPELKHQTGREPAVRDYVLGAPVTQEFLNRVGGLLAFLMPKFIEEGKNRLLVAVGCTGGMHRSVAIADEIGARLIALGYHVSVSHRDMERERAR